MLVRRVLPLVLSILAVVLLVPSTASAAARTFPYCSSTASAMGPYYPHAYRCTLAQFTAGSSRCG